MLDIEPLREGFAAAVRGVDLGDTPARERLRDALEEALARHLVLVFPLQDLDARGFLEAVQVFGPAMRSHYSQYHMPGLPDVAVLSSRDAPVGADGTPRLVGASCWHTDHINHRKPPKATALYAVALPGRGGGTCFADMRAAYRGLPPERRRRLDAMRTVNRLEPDLPKRPEDAKRHGASATHPLVRTHPVSGERALYFHPEKTQRIEGMSSADSQRFLAELLHEIMTEEIVYCHDYALGDVVVWDNRAALHRAQADYDPGAGRVMYRVLVGGDEPR